MTSKKWHCVYTKRDVEKRVSDQLRRKGIENFLPLTAGNTRQNDGKKALKVPLFTSYIFVNIDENDVRTISRIDGILSFVHWQNKPLVVRDTEINLMRSFLAENAVVQLEQSRINLNEMARIVTGPSSELSGNAGFAFTSPVRIILPSLGYALVAQTEVSKVGLFGKSKTFVVNKELQFSNP